MSTQIIQPYWKSIALPLKLLFERVLEKGKSSEDWEKKVLVHKKESKNLLKKLWTYQSSSLIYQNSWKTNI